MSFCSGLISLLLLSISMSALGNGRVEVLREHAVDVTGDGVEDRVVISITSRDWYSPVSWALTVESLGEIVLNHAQNDVEIDVFFHDSGYVSNDCSGYLECKMRYYLTELPNFSLGPLVKSKASVASLSRGERENELERYTKAITAGGKVGRVRGVELASRLLEDVLSRRLTEVRVLKSPVKGGGAYVYVRGLLSFVYIDECGC